jgi:type IV pilus assembly protein PilQ
MKTKAIVGAVLLLTGVILIGLGVNAQQAEPAAATEQPKPAPAVTAEQPKAAEPVAADQKTAAAAPVTAAPPAAAETAVAVSLPPVEAPTKPAQTPQAESPTTDSALLTPPEEKPIAGAKATTNAVNENLISITLDDVDMVDVVRMFTRISGANIITSPSNLQGKVSVNLTDVEWKPALDSILDMHNLALVEKTPGSKVFSIITKQAGPEPQLVETFFLKYASVTNVNNVVSSMLTSGGRVTMFPSRNALVVRATASNLGEIKQIIERIDKLRDQVFIEAKFMELNDSAIKDLGINWQVLQAYSVSAGNMKVDYNENSQWNKSRTDASATWDKRQNLDTVNNYYDMNGVQYEERSTTWEEVPPGSGSYSPVTVVTPTRTIVDTIDKGKNLTTDISDGFTKQVTDIRTAVLGIDDFKLTLSALKQLNGVSIVSNPKIIVANEEVATIHIGQTERPFVSSVTPGQQGIAPVVTYNPGDPVELGVKLTVTPTVNTASNITIRIQPELTRFMGNEAAPNGQTYPIVATKKITTIFCLESGKTVAIGGLTETNDRDVTKKIPLLGDIPLIGKYLFSHTHKEKAQTETIIFVTVGLALPDIMEDETGMPENTELTRRQLIEAKARRSEFLAELEKAKHAREAESDKKVQKARNRLLKKSN